jgi:hypothetical protein
MSTKRALLIGIDAYPHVPPLDGCVNDVRLMRSVLADSFGFAEDNMTLLADEQATRAGILAAFDALVSATGHDDIVVIHFAGHGSQMTDREGDEPSGFDSTIMPIDTARPPGPNLDITDDEIQVVLEALARKTPYTTLVVDACHSGTVTRDAFGGKARSVEPDRRPIGELPPSPVRSVRSRAPVSSGPSGWLPLADRYVLIAGCRDEERSYEYCPPESDGAVAHGALTYFLCQQLRQATSGTSYRDVFEQAAARVNAENAEQHPQMEGRGDREVFGVADLTPMRFARVTGRIDSTVVLAAGGAHGVTAGSTWHVHPAGTKDPGNATPLGEVEVTSVGVVTAEARITREAPPGAVDANARAFEAVHAFGDVTMAVQCVVPPGHEATAALQNRLEQSRLVKVVPDGTVAAARIYLLPARGEVSSETPVPQAGVLDAPRWAVVGQTGDLLMPLKAPGDEAAVVENLETLAKYRHALALENPDPGSRLRSQFAVDLLRRGRDGAWSVAEPETDGGHIVFEEGDAIAFRITSRHDAPACVTMLDFGLTGAIAQVFPPRHAQDTLAAGGVLEIGTKGGRPPTLTWPSGYPFVDSVDRLREAEGIETLKLFVTEQPADFFVLEQHGVRSASLASGASSPLAELLRRTFHGGATRDIVMVPAASEDWTTVSRSFVLRRRTSVPLPEKDTPVAIGTATLVAPGLAGTATTGFGRKGREEADRRVTGELHRALDASGIETRQTIEIAGAEERGPASRSIGDRPALEVRLPDPGPGYGQMVLAADELGVVSWCFGPPPPAATTRGIGPVAGARTYLVPQTVPAEIPPAAGARGIVGLLGSKLIKELVFPLIDPVLGEVSASFALRLEQKRSPYRLRTFTPDDYAIDAAGTIDSEGWARLAGGRALLMVHGTFSRTHLAFGRLPRAYVESLHRLYGGRVFAFDHFTLSHDPRENVRWFLSQVPEAAGLTIDIVSHSRGGLVSRLLSEKQGEFSVGARRLRVGKVVFVGAPSAGTALADPEHIGTVLDVFTNLLNIIPDNGIVEVLTMIVEVAKQVAIGALGGLAGLQSMRPNGEFTTWMNAGTRSGETQYFAVASNVTPAEPGLRHLALSRGLNRILQGAHDFVVPTEGVFAANGSGFFPIDDRLVLEGTGAAAHTAYFADARVRERILAWLST